MVGEIRSLEITMTITPLSQRDKRWSAIKLGTSNTTIGDFGCTITCIAMIVGTTPDVVNERMKQVAGFAEGNLVIWAKIDEAFPGIHARRVWTYDNADVKANIKRVLVEVDGKPIGGYRHWVVYVGSQKLYDPWDGKEDPTSDYPNPVSYCVLEGAWEKSEPVTTDLQAELDKTRKQRDENHNDRMALYEELGFSGVFNRTVAVEKIRQLLALEKQFVQKDEQLKVANEKIKELEVRAKENEDKLTEFASESTKTIQTLTTENQSLLQSIQELKSTTTKPDEWSASKLIAAGIRKWLGF